MFSSISFPALSLYGTLQNTRHWQFERTMTKTRSGHVLDRQGGRLEEGWRARFTNGLVVVGPFRYVTRFDRHGDTRVFGTASRKVVAAIERDSWAAQRERWGLFARLWAGLWFLPCLVLSVALTMVTLPLFALLWLVCAVVVLFWLMVVHVLWASTRYVFRRVLRDIFPTSPRP